MVFVTLYLILKSFWVLFGDLVKQEKKNAIVVKSNQMIEASYKLSLQEQRIILYMVSMIKPEDEDFKPVRISLKKFASMIDVQNTNHTYMQQITRSLLERVLTIRKPRSVLQIGWLSSAEYFFGQGYAEFCFDPKLKPYLLQLKERFTKYHLNYIIRLKHSYSIRFYELLKQYEPIGWRLFCLDDLKAILGITPDEYRLYSNFKLKVLNPVQKEFNTKYNKQELDFIFEYEEQKEGRKVTGLRFKIVKPPVQMELFEGNTYEDEQERSLDALEVELRSFKLTKKQTSLLIKKNTPEVIRRNVDFVQKKAANKEIRNIPAYLFEAIEGDFASTQTNEYDPEYKKLKAKAAFCWSKCNGGCAAVWENHKDNKLSDCYYCEKFESQRDC